MNCNEARDMMLPYLSGDVDDDVARNLTRHLQDCPTCKTEMERQEMNDRILREAFAAQQLNAGALQERVRHQIRANEIRRPAVWTQYRFQLAAAVLIALCAGLISFALLRTRETLYAGVVRDHAEDVVRQVPKSGWREGNPTAEKFASEYLDGANVLARLAPDGYRLVRARLCRPAGEQFLHLIYDNDGQQLSFYLRKEKIDLPGAPTTTVDGRALFAERQDGFEVAAFNANKFTVLLVSSLPRADNLRFASDALARIS